MGRFGQIRLGNKRIKEILLTSDLIRFGSQPFTLLGCMLVALGY